MEGIIPLNNIFTPQGLSFPIKIYTLPNKQSKISIFTKKEKEWFFNIKNLKISGHMENCKIQYNGPKLSSLLFENKPYLLAKYKIVVSTDNINSLQRNRENLDFGFKLLMGIGCPLMKIRRTSGMFNDCSFQTNKPIISRREEKKKFNFNLLERLRRIVSCLEKPNSDQEKVNLLKVYLDTAMSQIPNVGISGAFYVSILESIFVPEKESEIAYRLSMRLSKKRDQTFDYLKKIKSLYNKRSSIFHGGKDKFTKEELKFVEEEACWAIEGFLNNPEGFSSESLDKILLNN